MAAKTTTKKTATTKPKKLTPNQIAWQKEVKRIKAFIRRAEKRGYTFDVPRETLQMPKRVTAKALQAVKELRGDKLYDYAYYRAAPDLLISGKEGRKLERSASSKKAALTRKTAKARQQSGFSNPSGPVRIPDETEIVLQQVESLINRWAPDANWTPAFVEWKRQDRNILISILNGEINRSGREVVARRIQLHAEEIINIVETVLYASGGGDYKITGAGRNNIQFDITRFAAIIKGDPLTPQESIELQLIGEWLDGVEEL